MAMAGNFATAVGFLAACSLKATVLFALAWIAATVLRKQSAAARHCAWAAGILSALALPVCTVLLPAWRSNALGSAASLWVPAKTIVESSGSGNLPAMMVSASTASPWLRELSGMLLLIWAAGAAIFIARLTGGLVRGSAGAKRILAGGLRTCGAEICSALKIARPVRLVESGNPLAMPLTWGMFRPVVMLPANASQWAETRLRAVLLHEFGHVARYDWFLQLCGELARSLFCAMTRY